MICASEPKSARSPRTGHRSRWVAQLGRLWLGCAHIGHAKRDSNAGRACATLLPSRTPACRAIAIERWSRLLEHARVAGGVDRNVLHRVRFDDGESNSPNLGPCSGSPSGRDRRHRFAMVRSPAADDVWRRLLLFDGAVVQIVRRRVDSGEAKPIVACFIRPNMHLLWSRARRH